MFVKFMGDMLLIFRILFDRKVCFLDGFKRVFLKSIHNMEENKNWTLEEFEKQLIDYRDILLMSQEYLVPLLIQRVCEGGDKMTPFLNKILYFFQKEELQLKDHVQKMLRHMISCQSSIYERLRLMAPLVEADEEGEFFPFCYLLPPRYALILKDMLFKKMKTFPSMRSDFKNGVYKNMQALMRTAMRFRVGSYLKKLKEHEERVLEKRRKLESDPKKISSFQDMLRILSPSQGGLYDEESLREKIRVNGRSVSFIHEGEEYILKVRKQKEDMRDHAEIAYGLENGEKDIQDNYGAVFYGHLEADMKKKVHQLICDKSKNPRISLKAEDLTGDVVLFKVRHLHYFDYLSDPKHSFETFKSGLRKNNGAGFWTY